MHNSLTKAFYKFKFWNIKHSPEILLGVSIAATLAAVGTAIYSTTKLDKTLNPIKKKLTTIRKDLHDDTKIVNREVDVNELKKELGLTYAKAALQVGKLYFPSAAFLTLAFSCNIGSHNILKNRNVALAAAYTALEKGYDSYRQRVREKVGEEAEEKLYNDVHKDKVLVKDPETGKEKYVTKEIPHNKPDNFWNVTYAEHCRCWENDALLNYKYLMSQQGFFNEKLKRQGFLFLSDIYDALGLDVSVLGVEKARAAHYFGWIYDEKAGKDNYVSFGLTHPGTDTALPRVQKQIEGNFPDFYLDFNVDGDILSGANGKPIYSVYAKGGSV